MSESQQPSRAEKPHQDSHPGISTGNPLNAGGDEEARQEELERREGVDAGDSETDEGSSPDDPIRSGQGGGTG